jgi:hypothetical protein
MTAIRPTNEDTDTLRDILKNNPGWHTPSGLKKMTKANGRAVGKDLVHRSLTENGKPLDGVSIGKRGKGRVYSWTGPVTP